MQGSDEEVLKAQKLLEADLNSDGILLGLEEVRLGARALGKTIDVKGYERSFELIRETGKTSKLESARIGQQFRESEVGIGRRVNDEIKQLGDKIGIALPIVDENSFVQHLYEATKEDLGKLSPGNTSPGDDTNKLQR